VRRRYVPKSVEACAAGAWRLQLWRPGELDSGWREVSYRCRSWRHDGQCRQERAALDFRRISEAVEDCDPEALVYCVLTFARTPGLDPYEAFEALFRSWRRLYFSMRRDWPGLRYVATVESHRSGHPHVNVLLDCRELADAVRAHASAHPSWSREGCAVHCGRELLGGHLARAGFGQRVWVEVPRTRDGIVGYTAKLARLASEAGKFCQVPMDAPPRFRRLRASRGFLPPVRCRGSGEVTGRLVWSEDGRPLRSTELARAWDSALACVAGTGGAVAVELGTWLRVWAGCFCSGPLPDPELGSGGPVRSYQLCTLAVDVGAMLDGPGPGRGCAIAAWLPDGGVAPRASSEQDPRVASEPGTRTQRVWYQRPSTQTILPWTAVCDEVPERPSGARHRRPRTSGR
jgi:hypothetical protein